MKSSPDLKDALVFQAAWITCVAGGNAGAMVSLLLLLPLQARWAGLRTGREWRLVIGFAISGLVIDLALQHLGLLNFEEQFAFGIPLWLAVLWLHFAGTPFRSLVFLQHRLPLSAVLGAVGGPLSYVAGIHLGAASSKHADAVVALAMTPVWALLLPLFCYLARPRQLRGGQLCEA